MKIKELAFVRGAGKSISEFGIVAELDAHRDIAYVMTADMEENFGVSEMNLSDVNLIKDEDIKGCLEEIKVNAEKFPWFIIQLNDIEELKEYHIEENLFVKKCRNSVDV